MTPALINEILTPPVVEDIQKFHREEMSNVQQEGYQAALNGAARDDSPYGVSRPQYNHWIYGYMLGFSARRKEARNEGR